MSVSTHMTSVCVRLHTQDVCGCPSVHISARWSLDSARWPFPCTVWVILAHVGCLFRMQRTSVGVRQHTRDVRGCLWLSVGTHRTSVGVRQHTQDVRGCPPAHTGRLWVSASTHRTSVAVRGCPSAHTGRPWLSVCVHQHTQDIRGCPSVHISARWSLNSAR